MIKLTRNVLRRLFSFGLLALLILFQFSCVKPEVQNLAVNQYPNLPQLMQDALSNSIRAQAEIQKELSNGESRTIVRMLPDSSLYFNELSRFMSYDLNIPAFRGAISEIEGQDEAGNWVDYVLKENEKIKFSRARIYFTSANQIEAFYWQIDENNMVYDSRHEIMVKVDYIENKPLLREIDMKVGQKMLLRDSVNYALNYKFTNPD